MSLIEIVTDEDSRMQLSKVVDKQMVNGNEVIYIKEENLDNVKNIKLETSVINSKIDDKETLKRIIENSKNIIVNIDYNEDIDKYIQGKNVITFGYNLKSDITVSSINEEKSFLALQKNVRSIFGKEIEMQEIKADINYNINVYNVMIIIALTILYAK